MTGDLRLEAMTWTTEQSTSLNFSTPVLPLQDCDPFMDSTLVKVIKTIAYSVLSILTLGGNILVVVVIYRNRNLRTIINFLILNMSASDLLLPIFTHTIRIQRIYLPRGIWLLDGVFGLITCKVVPFLGLLSITVSILTLEIIAVERFFSVVLPMKRQPIRNNKTCFTVIALTWLIGAIYPCSYFYSIKFIHKGKTPYCIYCWEPAFDHVEAVKVDLTIGYVSFTVIPFLVLTGLYSVIIVFLHRQKVSFHFSSEAIQRRVKRNRRVTYMVVTVIAVFFVSWLPRNFYGFLSAFVWSSHRPCESRHLIFSAVFMSYLYPAINSFIYCIFVESYKKGFLELICCLTRCMPCCNNRNSGRPQIERNTTNVHAAKTPVTILAVHENCGP